MQAIAPYQLPPQDAQRIQYVVQPQQGQGVKVLTSSVIPQQQNYDPSILNQTQMQSFDNSISYNGPKSPILVQGGHQLLPQQVLQYSTQQGQIQPQKQVQQIQVNGQQAYPMKVQYTDRLNDTNDDRFKFSNISSISHNNSIYSHSRKPSDRIALTPTIASQIIQPGAVSQVINPLSTYNQQLQVHQQQKDRLNEIQNKTLNQTFTSNYNTRDDNEQRLRTLIKENEQLIKENEYYKRYLQGQPQQQQSNVNLQQQLQQLSQQNENLQVQLQIQRDEATMWSNREKEMNDRCKTLYEQLQLVKNGDALSLATQNQQLQQRVNQLEQNSQVQQRKIDELNACLQVYKDSMKNQGIIDYSVNQPKTGLGVADYQSYQSPSTSNGFTDYGNKNYYQTNPEPLSNFGGNDANSNQYAYSSPKQREEMVQSIIKQYKLGGNTPKGGSTGGNLSYQVKKVDDYSYNAKPAAASGGSNDILKQYDQDMGDWKTKYDSLTQKLNSLNTGGEQTPNKVVY